MNIPKAALGNKTKLFVISWKLYLQNCFVCKCNFSKRNHWTFEENEDKNLWFVRKCAVLMAAWLYLTYLVISLVPYFGARFKIVGWNGLNWAYKNMLLLKEFQSIAAEHTAKLHAFPTFFSQNKKGELWRKLLGWRVLSEYIDKTVRSELIFCCVFVRSFKDLEYVHFQVV